MGDQVPGMKPTPPPGKWRYQVVRGCEGRKQVPAAVNARLTKQLHEEQETNNEQVRQR